MTLEVKHFKELSIEELWEIYKLRVSVFVVEQHCPYQEIDDADKLAYHVFLKDDSGIQAYARVLPPNTVFENVSIGRVISLKRRCGLGTKVMRESINVAKEKFSATKIILGAQKYASPFYEKSGFVKTTHEYVEDGIPHVEMILDL